VIVLAFALGVLVGGWAVAIVLTRQDDVDRDVVARLRQRRN
jgi:hypothetical protein